MVLPISRVTQAILSLSACPTVRGNYRSPIQRAGLCEGQQTTALLVPQMQTRVGEALTDGHPVAICQFIMVAQHFGQTVERDAAVQVVDVVDANIGREPLQYGWQDIMRTAVQGGLVQLPVLVGIPLRLFKLVLNVKKPNASRSGNQR